MNDSLADIPSAASAPRVLGTARDRWRRSAPAFAAIVCGFVLAIVAGQIVPVFLSGSGMQIPNYVPRIEPIGADLIQYRSYVERYVNDGESPYVGRNLYPPLTTLAFAPFVYISGESGYLILSALTLVCWMSMVLLGPLALARDQRPAGLFALAAIILALRLYSYPLHFELERGQFNVIAVAFAVYAVLLFRRGPARWWARIPAYVLLTIAIQFKVYPAIFVLAMIERDRPLRSAVRLAGITALNVILLFSLGTDIFNDFIEFITVQMRDPYIWVGNHSLKSFATQAGVAEWMLWCLAAVVVLAAGIAAWRRRADSADGSLLLGLAVLSCIIPSVSHDYKLATLPFFAIWFLGESLRGVACHVGWKRLAYAMIAFVGAFLLQLTSMSYKHAELLVFALRRAGLDMDGRSLYLVNKFPLLMALGITCLVVVLLETRAPRDDDAVAIET